MTTAAAAMPCIVNGPDSAPLTLVLAHGAGAPMDSPFMNHVADAVSHTGWRVVRFEFPYMAERRTTGKKKPPNRAPILLDTWRELIKEAGPERLVIGGKSMGGRIASMVADDMGVRGVVCLGYPFHPPGKPEKLRTEHLAVMKTPTLILQGERDPFGTRDEVAAYTLSKAIAVDWLPDGDHSFKPRKKSGHTEDGNLALTAQRICAFLERLAD